MWSMVWLAGALLGDVARADDGDGMVIIVTPDAVRRAREAIESDLSALGYKEGKDKGDRTVYRPMERWKPELTLWDDGLVTLGRGSVLRAIPLPHAGPEGTPCGNPVEAGNPDGSEPVDPRASAAGCPSSSMGVSDRKLAGEEARVLEAIDPEVKRWQLLIEAEAQSLRLAALPAQFTALWEQGTPLSRRDGADLANPQSRRQALLDFWSSRLDNPNGDAARSAVEDFLIAVVQPSEFPVTLDEARRAEQEAGLDGSLCTALGIPQP